MNILNLFKSKSQHNINQHATTQANSFQKSDAGPVTKFCLIFGGIGLLAIIISGHTIAATATAILWAIACFISGNLIGFLFAIPKNSPSSQPPTSPNPATGANMSGVPYTPLINNNLIEISDWLTKIIVGLGLVQLTKIPTYMQGLATNLAMGMYPPNKGYEDLMARSYALIVGYFILGFLFAYLVMRLYLSGEMIKADMQNYSGLADKINAMGAKVDNLESGQSVLNQRVNQDPARAEALAPNTNEEVEAKQDQLRQMANDYDNVRIPDWSARVQKKEDISAAMAAFANTNQISKDDILSMYAASPSDGLLIALATLIILTPEAGDNDRLLRYGFQIRSKHVRYRTLNAIAKLLDQKLIGPSKWTQFKALVTSFRLNADNSLNSKIDEISSLLNLY
jgi:hypothetical protein